LPTLLKNDLDYLIFSLDKQLHRLIRLLAGEYLLELIRRLDHNAVYCSDYISAL
jgi:hypothetical protein